MPEFDFRPLSGNLIFQWLSFLQFIVQWKDFRPLSGNLIFQSKHRLAKAKEQGKRISVPYRGILFFNG